MKIPYGVKDGEIFHISEIIDRSIVVLCPYCQKELVAKKGKIKQHHFAHQNGSCTQHFSNHLFGLEGKLLVDMALSTFAKSKQHRIKMYEEQLMRQLAEKRRWVKEEQRIFQKNRAELHRLKEVVGPALVEQLLAEIEQFCAYKIAPFPAFHLLRSNHFSEGYTDGKRQCTAAEIREGYKEYYYPNRFEPFVNFLKNYHQTNQQLSDLEAKAIIFRRDLAFFENFGLYFLKIKADHQIIYKIGLSSRELSLRLAEIEQTLTSFFLRVDIDLLFYQKGVAFLERYFKQKYQSHQYKIGQLTEYFSFSNSLAALIIKDLNLLKINGAPKRGTEDWIDWVFLNFNGKIYGKTTSTSSYGQVYVNNQCYSLTSLEFRALTKRMNLKTE
ncbi:MAG: GIY-YIG nuclease family protein [Bacteroidota bacterium]